MIAHWNLCSKFISTIVTDSQSLEVDGSPVFEKETCRRAQEEEELGTEGSSENDLIIVNNLILFSFKPIGTNIS